MKTIEGATGEHLVMLDCVRRGTRFGECISPPPAEDWESIDWSKLARLAAVHGVLPLVATHLNAAANTPHAARQHFTRTASQIATRNLQLTGELISIARALGSAGIDLLPIKGPILAQYVYGDIGLRMFGDLDIVVRDRDVASTLKILARRGYKLPHRGMSRRNAAHAATFGHFSAYRAETAVLVEVHPQLVDPRFGFRVRNEDLFDHAEFITIAGHSLRTLARPDLLLYLCVHGSKHLWSRFEWIAAVGMLMEHGGFDVGQVIENANRLGSSRRLLLGMLLPHLLLGAPLDEHAWKKLNADKRVNDLAANILLRLFSTNTNHDAAGESVLSPLSFHAAAFDRAADRVRYLYRCVVHPAETEFSSVNLPDRLTPLYKPLRLARLALRSIRLNGR